MIRKEVQWIADDANNTANFKLINITGHEDVRHIRSGLAIDANGGLVRPSRLPLLFRAETLAVTDEERELLKTVRQRILEAHHTAKAQAAIDASTAVLRNKMAMPEKDYRLVEDKSINEP